MSARSRQSAGLLMYRRTDGELQVLLVHPGGPFWAKWDLGAWSIPKGEYASDEPPLVAAQREFNEETGFSSDGAEFVPLGELVQTGGKRVSVWAFAGDADAAACRSNTFEMTWPPGSGHTIVVPEVDRAGWFTISDARTRLVPAQVPFLDRLVLALVRVPDTDRVLW